MSDQEKRSYKRVKRPFTARIRPYQEGPDAADQAKWDIVTVRDLSASGMAFNYTKILPGGMQLEFNIPLPFAAEPIHCRGEICRTDDAQPSAPTTRRIHVYRVAVQFQDLSDAHRQALHEYLLTL